MIRSPLDQTPPCTSTKAGKGPTPAGWYTLTASPSWYSNSLTVISQFFSGSYVTIDSCVIHVLINSDQRLYL